MIKKNLDLIIVFFIMLTIIMYDVTIDLFGETLHLLFEVFHNLFEWVELGVEELVDKAFHTLHIGEVVAYLFITERHGSQVVTFYILMSFLAWGGYRLAKFLPRVYELVKRLTLIAWVRRKTQVQLFWYSINQWQKVAAVISAVIFLYLASFFVI
ncbi:hypothetical protein KEF85_15270 [Methylomonas paludis]|uniref:Uncharacterized protein n=1 Tax=Methylomonas paludis TaxID=1173101 RepID=A0A975MNK9_9GAMM|nr:hypothetical protein [Methylomonas paludis]QWF70661.1 hypothetical protein KEF85_15270 [Methylomonas paludis]